MCQTAVRKNIWEIGGKSIIQERKINMKTYIKICGFDVFYLSFLVFGAVLVLILRVKNMFLFKFMNFS